MTASVRFASRVTPLAAFVLAGGLLSSAAGRVDTPPAVRNGDSVLAEHLLVTWYGNPHTGAMGVLGMQRGAARVDALKRQATAYAGVTPKRVLPAYHLVATVAQPTAGRDGKWRRREATAVVRAMLEEARAHGFPLIVDIQPGHADVADEVRHLRPFLEEPDVHLALDPEFAMHGEQVPGRVIGRMHAAEVNAALDELEKIMAAKRLPPKVVIVHQFTLAMLPDKKSIRPRPRIDLVLGMDGFGPPALKRATYRAVMRQGELPFAGFKLFYRQDTELLPPARVMQLAPTPSVIIYQ
jgi:hypothetical protein